MEEPAQNEPIIVPTAPPEIPPLPWTVRDTWMGALLTLLVMAGIILMFAFLPRSGLANSIALVVAEPLFLLPVVIIFGWKRISWKHLGFRGFKWTGLAIGIGVLVVVYPLILIHNLILVWLRMGTQGDSIVQALKNIGSPALFVLASVILAPLAEEVLFRGFLFAGFRQRYGWVQAILLSSAIFALFHLQLAAFIPTFMLGAVLAFTYQRSNSIWPGIILHFLVNALGVCATLFALQMGALR